jgi:hypothetical protein
MSQSLSDNTDRKFIEEFDVSDYEILTEDGYKDITSTKKTVEYDVWRVELENGHFIECADTHILIDDDGNEIYAMDSMGVNIDTVDGMSCVANVCKIDTPSENMYDLSVDSDAHTYYSNGVLSHNSISSCAYLLWFALFHSEQTIAILANKGSTSQEMLGRITLMLENIPYYLQPGCKTLNKKSIEFSNNSRIIASATSGSSIRGFACNLIYLDEFAFVEDASTFYTSTYPVITSGKTTKVIITSTANGVGNQFHSIWSGAIQGTNSYLPFRVDWWDVPGRDDTWKQETIANTSQLQFDQEFGNNFHGTGNTLINAESLLELRSADPILIRDQNTMKVYEEPNKEHTYMMIVDVAKGRGADYSTFNIIDVATKPFKQVCVFRDNTISPMLFPNVIYKWAMLYNEAYVVVESNDQGGLVCSHLYHDFEYENMYIESAAKNALGMTMNKKTKRLGCSNIKDIIESRQLVIYDSETISELSTFEAKGSSYAASGNNHDDLAMNLVMFGWFTTTDVFKHTTDIDVRKMLYMDTIKQVEEDIVPIGFLDDGYGSSDQFFDDGSDFMSERRGWQVVDMNDIIG